MRKTESTKPGDVMTRDQMRTNKIANKEEYTQLTNEYIIKHLSLAKKSKTASAPKWTYYYYT